MENAWSRAKRALSQRLCISLPRTRDDVAGTSSYGAPSSNAGALSSHSVSGSRSSKKICAICLGGLKSGHGQAIFTSECSHTFHFQCISSNVKHGNYVCPVCRAKWKDIPSVMAAPTENIHGRARVNPINVPHEGSSTNVLSRFVHIEASNRNHRSFHLTEPGVFDDDEFVPSTSETHHDVKSGPSETVRIKTFSEYSAVPPLASKDEFAILIHLKAPHGTPTEAQTRAPIDLVTVLDVSGSMLGTKLALLKRAMGFLIHNLSSSDRLSVVAFSSSARRLFPLSRMSGTGRQRALQAVNSLFSSGGTNIADGLRKAAKIIEDRKQKSTICSIMLLSDGKDTCTIIPNRARLDYKPLVPSQILQAAASGVQTPVHTFGFGVDHDSAAMHYIAENSHGTFSFIENEGVIQDAFAQCLGGLLSVVVQSMRLHVECLHSGVVLTTIHSGSYSNELCNNGQSGLIEVGDLYAEEERDFLLSLKVPPACGELETPLIEVSYSYNDPISKDVIKLEGENVTIKRPENSNIIPVMSIEVDRERNRVRVAEAMSVARTAAERGALAEAVLVLEDCRKLLAESHAARGGDRLCIALDAELREMQERMASRQRYEESGRAYMLSGLSSHWSQRATTRGDSTESDSMVHSYQTPSMVDMLQRSQTFYPTNRETSRPKVRLSRSFGGNSRRH